MRLFLLSTLSSTRPQFRSNELLSYYCTLGIGGPARFLTVVETQGALEEALSWAKEQKVPLFILGKGSNCLFEERGFAGLVIVNAIDFMHFDESAVEVGAGTSMPKLSIATAKKKLGDLSFAAGIPGSVGGGICMNAGAHGGQISDQLERVDSMTFDGQRISRAKNDIAFSYRHSAFQTMKEVIVGARFSLVSDPHAEEKRKACLDQRAKTQPIFERSAGCIFCNPPKELGLSAGKLIDDAGLKGLCVGKVRISQMHGNFFVSEKGATASDLKTLIDIAREKVKKQFGIELETEIRVIPYEF